MDYRRTIQTISGAEYVMYERNGSAGSGHICLPDGVKEEDVLTTTEEWGGSGSTGKRVTFSDVFCPRCTTYVRAEWRTCPECGLDKANKGFIRCWKEKQQNKEPGTD